MKNNNILRKNKLLSLPLSFFIYSMLFAFFTLCILVETTVNVSSQQPTVTISPECGEIEDHRVNLTVNGFNGNGNVHWEFVNPEGKKEMYGYFDTNETGGFDDYTIAEHFEPTTYILRFFDDKNNDFIKDTNASEVLLNYKVPC